MNKIFKSIIFLFWLMILFIFFKYKLYHDGANKIISFLRAYPEYSKILFLTISSLRILTFLPSTLFIFVASILFTPTEAILLATIANLLSELLVFFFAKLTVGMKYQEKLISKYPKIYKVMEKNNIQILALGVSSPIVPSDVVCFFSVLTGITLKKYLITIFLADTPIIFLYTFLGISMNHSLYVFIVAIIVVILISYFNYRKWNNKTS